MMFLSSVLLSVVFSMLYANWLLEVDDSDFCTLFNFELSTTKCFLFLNAFTDISPSFINCEYI